jgi:post-segregation antitoxin (ccd killing protein)
LKKRTTLFLESDLLDRAHVLGINVSKVVERFLRFYIEGMEKTDSKIQQSFLGEASSREEGSVDRAGFEPATSALRMRRSCQTELSARPSF